VNIGQSPQTSQIRVPFDMEPVGLGDIVKKLTDFLHIPQCGGCQERQQYLNERVQVRSLWED
jgi:hypothetical protein